MLSDRTRSGRKVKKSSRLFDNEYRSGERSTTSGNDQDFEVDEEFSTEESDRDSQFDNEDFIGRKRHSSRLVNKSETAGGLTWKDGKLVPLLGPVTMPVLKRRRRQKSNINEEIMNRINVVKDDRACRFYNTAINSLKNSSFSYPPISLEIGGESEKIDGPELDLLKDERFCLRLETKNQSLIPKYDKSSDKINEIVGIPLDIEDLKKYARVTGFILFTIVSKKKFEVNASENSQSHRKVQDNWNTIPERTKRDWEIKAKQVTKLVDNKRRNDEVEHASKEDKRRAALKKAEESIKKSNLTDHTLADLAFHLKAISCGMANLSTKIATHEGIVGIKGVESVMLDYLLCSLVSLVGIFQESEGLDKGSTTDSLNKLTFIMPGLN